MSQIEIHGVRILPSISNQTLHAQIGIEYISRVSVVPAIKFLHKGKTLKIQSNYVSWFPLEENKT